MKTEKQDNFFVINYHDPEKGKPVSIKAKTISDSSLGLSFVRVSDFIFSEDHLVVTPEEESQKKRFEYTKNIHLSIYTILSIREEGPDHKGLEFKGDKTTLLTFPKTGPTPPEKQ
jgi:hypothetical protein